MKKILIAFNGNCFPAGALEFALQINTTQPVLLTGVFIPQATYSYLWSGSAASSVLFPPLPEEVSSETVEENIIRFKEWCQTNDVKYKVHKDFYHFALPLLIKETRFADLLIVDSEKFYESISKGEQNSHLTDVLRETECPVLIVPEEFQFPDRNILAYDGSESFVYAIKEFAYLFPEFTSNETLLVFLKNDEKDEVPDETFILELGNQHYKNLKLLNLDVDPKKYFATWLSEEKKAILVTGSFGRSTISQLFKKSFVKEIIAEHDLPVFIAHK